MNYKVCQCFLKMKFKRIELFNLKNCEKLEIAALLVEYIKGYLALPTLIECFVSLISLSYTQKISEVIRPIENNESEHLSTFGCTNCSHRYLHRSKNTENHQSSYKLCQRQSIYY